MIATRQKRARRFLVRRTLATLAACAFAAFAGVLPALAQSCTPEAEPNDTPAEAQAIAGVFCVSGGAGGPGEDVFAWTVSDADAQRPMRLLLQGLPGEDLELELVPLGPDGETAGMAPVFSSAGAPAVDVETPPIDFAAGRYSVSVKTTGGLGLYRLFAEIPDQPEEPATGETTDDEPAAATFTATATAEGPVTFPWPLDATDADQRWSVTVTAPGQAIPALDIVDPTGTIVIRTYAYGGAARLSDLALAAGQYSIAVIGADAGTPVSVTLEADGQRQPAYVEEPNDATETAFPLSQQQALTGRLIPSSPTMSDVDELRLSVGEALRDRRFDLKVTTPAEIVVALIRPDGTELLAIRGSGELRLADLVLDPGDYRIQLRGGLDPEVVYAVAVEDHGPALPGEEREPNTYPDTPSPLNTDGTGSGWLRGDDSDAWSLVVEGAPQLWQIEAEGTGLARLLHFDASGATQVEAASPGDNQDLVLSRLLLLPGPHVFIVRGSAGEYRIKATRIGDFDPARDEVEPNDTPDFAQELAFGAPRKGRLDRSGDRDTVHFRLAGEALVRLQLSGSPGSHIRANLTWQDNATEVARAGLPADATMPLVWAGRLSAGDYYVTIDGDLGAEYDLVLERLPYFAEFDDIEPNNSWPAASPLPSDRQVHGLVHIQDLDWYRLPPLAAGSEVVLRSADSAFSRLLAVLATVVPPPGPPQWLPVQPTFTYFQSDGEGAWRAAVPEGGGEVFLYLESGTLGAYDIDVEFDGPAGQSRPNLPLAMALSLAKEQVAANARTGQHVEGVLAVTNTGAASLELAFSAHPGDESWIVDLDPEHLTLAPGATADVAVTVDVGPDARADGPVPVSIVAEAASGGIAWAEAPLEVERGIAPVAPVDLPLLPEPLLGRINVALAALGGAAPEAPQLIDGLSGPATTFRMRYDQLPALQPVIDLAGEDPVAIAGFILDSTTFGPVRDRLRDFTLSTSLDGVTFEPVLSGRLSPRPVEQGFVLDRPVEARFVRLEPIANQFGNANYTGADIGEIKVIAAESPFAEGLDIARPALGGHVVWTSLGFPARPLLTEAADATVYWLEGSAPGPVQWVIGFKDNRAAQIVEVQWQEGADPSPESLIPAVTVSVSTTEAGGPWTDIADWTLARDASGLATMTIDAPVWARYVRFTPAAPPEGGRMATPDRIGIIERPGYAGYRSMLGEWGDGHIGTEFEQTQPAAPVGEAAEPASGQGADRLTPAALEVGVATPGSVRLGAAEAWYRLQVGEGMSYLDLIVAGDSPEVVSVTLETVAGDPIVLRRRSDGDGAIHFEADVAPGEYLVHLAELPRSILVTWDTSGSIGAARPAVVETVLTLVASIRTGREEMNLLPFRGDQSAPLLEQFSGDPLAVFTALQSYPWLDSSSNTEAALLKALEALRERPGKRAIVLVTDAETDGEALRGQLWQEIVSVRPRIFALEVPTGSSAEAQWASRSLMQDLATFNGGFFQQLTAAGDTDTVLDRIAASLDSPVAYQLTANLMAAPPAPGQLEVVAPDPAAESDRPPARGAGAVEIILDASGSMLQRMGDERRIEVAKSLLGQVVTETLSAGTPFALRVFGEGAPESCDTELLVSLGPLDPAQALAAIQPIEPTNLARTPIADSLRLSAEDLAAATGARLVVLITDGEETCGGDPLAEIKALGDAGIAVRVNIVGFALDDPALKQTFTEWAEAGNGRFIEAADAAALGPALESALLPPFEVVDREGVTVLEGTVGSPESTLPAGSYVLRILTEPAREIAIEIRSGETTRIDLGQ